MDNSPSLEFCMQGDFKLWFITQNLWIHFQETGSTQRCNEYFQHFILQLHLLEMMWYKEICWNIFPFHEYTYVLWEKMESLQSESGGRGEKACRAGFRLRSMNGALFSSQTNFTWSCPKVLLRLKCQEMSLHCHLVWHGELHRTDLSLATLMSVSAYTAPPYQPAC